MKKKIVLSVLFIVSLIPMLFNQYGGAKGVQEISGLINLLNPIGIISFILFFIGIWLPFKNKRINKILGVLGALGMVLSEIYKFLTWYIPNYEGSTSLQYSLNNVFPEFYIGLIVSVCMVIAYFIIDIKIKE
mgnify:CR=1 FL=1